MADVREAKANVNELELARQSDQDENGDYISLNSQDLARGLKIISDELYSKPVHFIMELVQNADDNHYPADVTPTLTLRYREDGFLWVACNEVGFKKENVVAICRISNSTKKCSGSQKGYIGEKGIGFKSVFKVADNVWVSSRPYQFKLNNNGLGMITPIWSDFKHSSAVKEQTMFCLQIPDEKYQEDIKGKMLRLCPELLMFLRKLRKIHITVADRNDNPVHDFWLQRSGESPGQLCNEISLLRKDERPVAKETEEHLLVFRHTANGMPPEEKRKDVTESEITMAFPRKVNDSTPHRDTYAFLPVRNYGLPFLLHADFLLTANRQDIVEGNRWNETLKEEATQLFLRSVAHFNETGVLKYEWPRLAFSEHNPTGTFFDGFLRNLRIRLRGQKVLESRAGTLETPASLFLMPDEWMLSNGQPLFNERKHLRTYAANAYLSKNVRTLGLNKPPSTKICGYLNGMPPQEIHDKPTAWHSKLANALLAMNTQAIRDIELVPMRDGQWLKASVGAIFFPGDGRVTIPDGIDVRIVDEEACKDPARKRLFEKLGVKDLDPIAVCNLIITRHQTSDQKTSGLSIRSVVDQAWFLFKARHKLLNQKHFSLRPLRLAVKGSSKLADPHEVAMDSDAHEFKMSQHYSMEDQVCSFIAPEYILKADQSNRTEWMRWLRIDLGVHVLPKLVDMNGGMDRHFQHLIEKHPSSVWLKLLRDNWLHYFSNGDAARKTIESLRLRTTLVDCKSGAKVPLCEVYLETGGVKSEGRNIEGVEFLDVDDPDNLTWSTVAILGLTLEPDLRLCMKVLRNHAQYQVAELDLNAMAALFQTIEKRAQGSQDDLEKTRRFFREEKLIPVTYSNSTTWYNSSACRWSAPSCLSSLPALNKWYSLSWTFFKNTLQIANASASDLVEEIIANAGDLDKADEIKSLLFALDEYLAVNHADDVALHQALARLKRSEAFPVRTAGGEVYLASGKDESWHIADRDRHFYCFSGKIGLLDCIPQEIPKLQRLFTRLGQADRYLSNSIKEETVREGATKYARLLSEHMRAKARFVSMIVDEERRDKVRSQMQSIEVYSVRAMRLRRYVTIDGVPSYGNDEIGRVVLAEQDDFFRLYSLEQYVEKHALPWAFVKDRLASVFELPESKQVTLLAVLISSDEGEIRDVLERAGLWTEDYVPEAPPEPPRSETPVRSPEQGGQGRRDSVMNTQSSRSPARASTSGLTPGTRGLSNSDPQEDDNTMSMQSPNSATGVQQGSQSTGAPMGNQPPASKAAPAAPAARAPPLKTGHEILIESIEDHAETYDTDDMEVITSSGNDGTIKPEETDLLQGTLTTPSASLYDGARQFKAELFSFKVLQKMADIADESWTSKLRSRYENLPDFIDAAGTASTFTVVDPDHASQITNWVLENTDEQGGDWLLGADVVYHIDVKTTTTKADTFHFSLEQMRLSRLWYDTDTDVHLIFQVYDLDNEPKICAYLDPVAMMLAGKLKFAAPGGYALKVA